MTTHPTFESVDNYTADLLDLVARTDHPSPDREWQTFLDAISHVAYAHAGQVDQNDVRPLIRGRIAPKRIGAFYRRACLEGRIYADGWSVSEDHEGRNAGRPMRKYRRAAA